MFSEDRRYVRHDDADNPFKDGEAWWVDCGHCGQALLIPTAGIPYCNGRDAGGCSPKDRKSEAKNGL